MLFVQKAKVTVLCVQLDSTGMHVSKLKTVSGRKEEQCISEQSSKQLIFQQEQLHTTEINFYC